MEVEKRERGKKIAFSGVFANSPAVAFEPIRAALISRPSARYKDHCVCGICRAGNSTRPLQYHESLLIDFSKVDKAFVQRA